MKRFACVVAMLLLAGCSAQTGQSPSAVPVAPLGTPPAARQPDPPKVTSEPVAARSEAAQVLIRFADLVTKGDVQGAASLLAPHVRAVYQFKDYAPLFNTPHMEVVRLVETGGYPDIGGGGQAAEAHVFALDVRYKVLGIIDSMFKDGAVFHHRATVAKETVDGPWLITELSGITAGDTNDISSPAQTELLMLAAKPATITYGSTGYTFAVPAKGENGNSDVTAGDVPGGTIWLTPPGFPDVTAHPIRDWSLWFIPASTPGGSLWTGAQRWQTFAKEQAPRLVGVTGGYAIIRLTEGGETQIMAVRLTDGDARTIAHHAPGSKAGYGQGVYAWQDADRQLHVVKLATGEERVVSLPALTYIEIVGAGILVNGQVVKLPLVDHLPDSAVPADYKWIGPGQGNPRIAVPGNWIVKQIPGGSSQGVSATNPRDPNAQVVFFDSACAGCPDPGVSSPHMYNSFASPLLAVARGATYTWLNEQTVAFNLPADDQHPYPTYGVSQTYTYRPGRREAKVSVPASDRQTATIILNSLLSRP